MCGISPVGNTSNKFGLKDLIRIFISLFICCLATWRRRCTHVTVVSPRIRSCKIGTSILRD